MPQRAGRPAITLIELLVVLAIVSVLVGLALSGVQRVRAAAARAACLDRLRQLGLAAHHHHAAHGAFPPGVSGDAKGEPHPWMGWHARLLPYLERDDLWRLAEEAYRLQPNRFQFAPHPIDVVVPPFACPADSHAAAAREWRGVVAAHSSYLGASGTGQARRDGVLYRDSRTRFADLTDGSSQTLFAGERPGAADGCCGWWYAGMGQNQDGSTDSVLSTGERGGGAYFPGCPTTRARFGPGKLDDQCAALHFWSLHPSGAHFLFADGAARFVPYSAADLLPALATRAGGEPAELP